VGKPSDLEGALEEGLEAREILGDHRDVEIQAHHWLDVGVDDLAPDHAVPDSGIGKRLHEPVEEAGAIRRYGPPAVQGLPSTLSFAVSRAPGPARGSRRDRDGLAWA